MKKLLYIFCSLISIIGNAQTWTNYTVGNTSKGVLGGYIRGIANDRDSSVWFATSDGVSRFYKSKWKNYSSEDGLASNLAYFIATDNKGLKWVSTDKGVSSFDGSKWTNYSYDDTILCAGAVTKIDVDKFNNVWFASFYGITKFDGKNWTKHYETGYNDGLACDSNGNIWFGSRVNGLLKFDGIDWIKYDQENSGLISNTVYNIIADSVNNIWISTRYGASKYDGKNWTTIRRHPGGIDDEFNHIVFEKNNAVIFVHYDSISRYDGTNFTNIEFPENLLLGSSDVSSDLYGNIWFPKYSGVYKYDGVNWTFYNPGSRLVDNTVLSLASDDQNNIWCGTDFAVSKFDGNKWTTYNADSGLYGETFKSMAFEAKNGAKWFSSVDWGTGVILSRFEGGKWTKYAHDDIVLNGLKGFINSITIDQNNVKWFGGGGSSYNANITFYNNGKSPDPLMYGCWNNCYIGTKVTSLAVDAKNNIWAGIEYPGFLKKFDGKYWNDYRKASDKLILSIALGENESVWCGTEAGVLKFDGVQWIDYSESDTSTIGQVNAITIDAAGNVWCGYNKKGVKMYNGQKWTSFTTANGLAHNDVGSILIDNDGNKWFGTWGGGLSKFSDGGTGPLNVLTQTQKGVVFHDLNANGKIDKGETRLAGHIINVDKEYTTTQSDGVFYSLLSKGNHTLKYRAQSNWKLTTDSLLYVNVNDNPIIDTLYFGVQAISNIHELQINLTGSAFRAGFEGKSWINYSNGGTLAESGSVSYSIADDVNLIQAIPPADSIKGKSLTWKFANLIPNEQREIQIITKMPGVSFLGDTFVSISRIKSSFSEDSDTLKQVLTGSYDPNDKLVAQGIGSKGYVLFGQELEYTVRFQNTGSDTAFNVNISDTLDKNLDVSSLQILAFSHPVKLNLQGENKAVFNFENILLPPQQTNDPGSNGFVKYSIRPKRSLSENTTVKNKANIYFDFNPAIITNETVNTYVGTLSSVITGTEAPLSQSSIEIFPNPAKEEFTIILPGSGVYEVSLTNMYGVSARNWSVINKRESTLSINGLEPGMYVYMVKEDNGEKFIGKLIVSR